jgi:photosystem II stability/assembly factor-like uncharacterized protein
MLASVTGRWFHILLMTACLAAAQKFQIGESGATVSLRGVSAVDQAVAWASGANGMFLRTTDGGKTWAAHTVPGAADLDFRDVEAVDDRTAYLLSSGAGSLSRIYKTTNSGETWTLQHTNLDPKGFLDCMAFWDATHGIALGDPVEGRFSILTTRDGLTWLKRPGPKANEGEGAFAASGSCIFARGTREAWFGTGGAGGARVFHTTDGGETWSVAKTPVRGGSTSAGIFSLFFYDGLHGVAVGGEYTRPGDMAGNCAVTDDGGKSWKLCASGPRGYRSSVAQVAPGLLISVGPSGSDSSMDGGKTWEKLGDAGFHALSSRWGFAVGANGSAGVYSAR